MSFTDILYTLQPVSLTELNGRAELMHRSDRKFIFPRKALTSLLQWATADYQALDIDGVRDFEYHTRYYDTPNLLFYHEHQRGRNRRLKVREREYAESGLRFIEVKQRTLSGRTLKFREPMEDLAGSDGFLEDKSGFHATDLIPTLDCQYHRITLLHKRNSEKITLDYGLSFSRENSNAAFSQILIVEVKSQRHQDSGFRTIAREWGVREGGMSKYCMGVLSLYPGIKHHYFKRPLAAILKINENG